MTDRTIPAARRRPDRHRRRPLGAVGDGHAAEPERPGVAGFAGTGSGGVGLLRDLRARIAAR